MQNERPFDPQTQPANTDRTTSSQAWSDFERDLETLGRQLGELRMHTATLGDHLINRLQASYDQVKGQASTWKQMTERQIEDARRSAWQRAGEAQSAYGDVSAKSKETARQIWERSEPLRQGAKDVGEGLTRAWSELRISLGKARERLQAESAKTNSSNPDRQSGSS